ncbi:MAG TPA: winged helix-turn-helix domain-containing protein [Salinimicrobium sp.]|nr:winged helix-turn-helix domain-containing protein [Salinimicrobium sp.]
MKPIKTLFAEFGSSPKNWEIFRGDSFQLEIPQPEEAYLAALRIKAEIKLIKNLDVRMAIGIGKKQFDASKITESNGEAFVNSGEKFEILKKEKINLAIKSPWDSFDREMNLFFKLALNTMDNWSVKSVEIIRIMLKTPDINQKEIGKILGIAQSSVSERQKRAFWSELMEIDAVYREKLKKLME